MTIGRATGDAECSCHACSDLRAMMQRVLIVCGTCGNKRCPNATDHNLVCTGSNEPGQKGSVYE